jgi:hypothetical protein
LEVVGNVAGIEIKKPLKSLTVKGFKIPKSVRNKMRTPNPYTESVFDFLDKTTPNQSFLIENLSTPATGGASILVLVAIVVQDSDGQKYLMGDKLRPAVYAGSPDGFGTGKETAARKGIYPCRNLQRTF